MKYKVVKNFIDKETNKKHLANSDYEPSSQKRGKELVGLGYLKEIKESKSKKGDK